MIRRVLILNVISCLIVSPVYSQQQQNNISGLSLSKELQISGKGNEFVSGDYPGAVLMKVNLWGAIQKPGIHYIPARTDLITLLSYAGGPNEKALLGDVIIKRWAGGKEVVMEVDVQDLLTSTGEKSPQLESNDVIIIPAARPAVSQDTISIIGLAASIVSIALAGFVISKNIGK